MGSCPKAGPMVNAMGPGKTIPKEIVQLLLEKKADIKVHVYMHVS